MVLKQRMTAMELIRAAHALHDLSMELHSHLAKICGTCDGCDGSCTFEDWEKSDIDLPDYLREKAGIPEEAKLYAWADDEEQTVTIGIADYDHDLRDVPPEALEMFAAAHVCIGELEERIVVGDIVYGEN